jgi:hypothetical protein
VDRFRPDTGLRYTAAWMLAAALAAKLIPATLTSTIEKGKKA